MPELVALSQVIQKAGVPRPLATMIAPFFGRLTRLMRLNKLYSQFHAQLADLEDDPFFYTKALRTIQAQFEIETEDYERIPKSGSLIVVANHPCGGVDGIILGALLKNRRPDAKIITTY